MIREERTGETVDYGKRALKIKKGRIAVQATVPVRTHNELSTIYTPGVAALCRKITDDADKVYDYTMKRNFVAVVTDGSAVLGLGNIGPRAGMPVMEGKCVLFKEFAGIDAVPICLDTQKPSEIIATVRAISPSFGGINLEDIKAPGCFEILNALQDLDIPVFHDDQDGTAIVILAALLNAAKVVRKDFAGLSVAVVGAGAAGVATVRLLLAAGLKDIVLVDSKGIVQCTPNNEKEQVACEINPKRISGSLSMALIGKDVFIGVSQGKILSRKMVESMAKDPIVFALANPEPEILPPQALAAGSAVVATGRSDYPNQINNALVFPGLFRGLLDGRIKTVTPEMKLRVARTLARRVKHPKKDHIIPDILDRKVPAAIARAVKKG